MIESLSSGSSFDTAIELLDAERERERLETERREEKEEKHGQNEHFLQCFKNPQLYLGNIHSNSCIQSAHFQICTFMYYSEREIFLIISCLIFKRTCSPFFKSVLKEQSEGAFTLYDFGLSKTKVDKRDKKSGKTFGWKSKSVVLDHTVAHMHRRLIWRFGER